MNAGPGDPGGPLRAGLVVNPVAWTNRTYPEYRRALGHAFAPLGEVVETPDPALLPALLRRWRDEGVQILAVSGGDGTVHAVVNALVPVWEGRPLPRLVLLHCGTMGVTPRAACARSPLRQLASLRRAQALGEPLPTRSLQTLRVGDLVAFNFGLGVFADLPAELSRRGRRGPAAVRGLGVEALTSALVGGPLATRALRGWHGDALQDGEALGHGHLTGLYATALDRSPLLHLRGFAVAARPAGHVRVMSMDVSRWELLRSLVPFALGWRRGVTPGVRVEAARVVDLRPVTPACYLVDGELHPWEGPLRIEAGPVLEVVAG